LVALRQEAHVEGEMPVALPVDLGELARPIEDVPHVSFQSERMQPFDLRRWRCQAALLGHRRGGGVKRPCGGAHMMRRRGRLDHQIEAESASRTDPARHFDVTSHELYVAAADRQAEPGATAALPL